jgi:hypothetical protein
MAEILLGLVALAMVGERVACAVLNYQQQLHQIDAQLKQVEAQLEAQSKANAALAVPLYGQSPEELPHGRIA